MIEMLRLDFRLIHGQTGVYWTAKLGCDRILIVSDTLLQDPIRLATVKLSKPAEGNWLLRMLRMPYMP